MRSTTTRICENCGVEFTRAKYRERWQPLKFCSRKCFAKSSMGIKNPNYKGGYVNEQGYHLLRVEGKQVYRSRYTMEQAIGRKLNSYETVHHINGNRADDRIENLELWSNAHASGQKVEEKINWAIDFLKNYNYSIIYENNGLGI